MKVFEDRSPAIDPIAFPPERRARLLSGKDLEMIDQTVMSILGDVGIKFPYEPALDILEAAGAIVDRRTQMVKMPADLVRKALATVPAGYTMGSRGEAELDVVIDGRRTYCGTDGTGINIADMDTGQIKSSTKSDLANMAKVADYLSSVSFFWPMLSAQDYPLQVMSLHELDASIRNTSKHIHLISCADRAQAKWAAKMADVAAGTEARRLARPPFSILTCALSPLSQEAGGLSAGLEFAKAGLPVGLATMPMLGGTAPASIPSLLAMGVAELLSAAVFFQLAQPGTKLYCALFSTIMNPYSGSCMSSTNLQALLNAAPVDIFRFYKIPVMASYGSGDSNRLDSWTFGRDTSVDTVFQYMMQPDMFPGFGLMDNDTLCYPEQMLLDDYIYSTIKTLSTGLAVDEASLALKELAEVGVGGTFMARPFTMKNIRKLWKGSVRHRWDQENKNFMDMMENAKEQIKWIWENHRPMPLSPDQDQALADILKAAHQELVGV